MVRYAHITVSNSAGTLISFSDEKLIALPHGVLETPAFFDVLPITNSSGNLFGLFSNH